MKHSPSNKIKARYLYLSSFLILIGSFVHGMVTGASDIGLEELFDTVINGNTDSPAANIFIYVRLPRVLAAAVCGAALSVSGAVIQGVLSNRLASPSIIGVNSGAGLAVTVCAALGTVGGWQLSLFAFLGAFLAVLPVVFGAKKWGASRGTVILIGVALNSFLGAISDTVVTFSPEVSISNSDFRIGDFSAVTYAKLIPAATVIVISIVLLLTLSNELSVLTLGEEGAKGLGMNTGLARMIFLLLATLLSGCAVSICGLVSFVGLLIPHAVRRLARHNRHLIPLCALFGAGFVTLCDNLSRTLFSPYEIPVGIILAFLGAPFFIFILIKEKGDALDD
ncbi:MAG: iron ABC transporter permease [Ruminococcaceae bacterium]|nr:iron ABC transporter permease [Oscillospiraceae bacterium]